MHIEQGGTTWVDFESEYAKGHIDIAPEVDIDYVNEPDEAGSFQPLLTVDGKVLRTEWPELRIGGKSYGKLAGKMQIQISRAGVIVNGEKRGEL